MATSDFVQIRYDHPAEGVARITLARADTRNAQDRKMLYEINTALDIAMHDDDVRVVILAADGPHFSSGHHLGDGSKIGDHGPPVMGVGGYDQPGAEGYMAQEQEIYLGFCWRWRNLPKPTIAQVQGYCIFGGYMFTSAMDLIVAADDAMFLPSITQYFSAPWDVGVRKAKEILFQSRFVNAQEALRTGLANMVVPRAELERETLALAGRIAETDAFTLRMLKYAINNAQDEMGYHTAVRNAHSHHFLTRVQEYAQWDRGEGRGPKRMPGVEQALKKSRFAPEK